MTSIIKAMNRPSQFFLIIKNKFQSSWGLYPESPKLCNELLSQYSPRGDNILMLKNQGLGLLDKIKDQTRF